MKPIIPHHPIPLASVRAADIVFLLGLGAFFELSRRLLEGRAATRSSVEWTLRRELQALRLETAKKRQLGPAAFVETSKLERAVLAKEKELAKVEAVRTQRTATTKRVLWNMAVTMNLALFALYFGTPLVSIDGARATPFDWNVAVPEAELPKGYIQQDVAFGDDVPEEERAIIFWKGMLFPLSYVALPMRVSEIGLPQGGQSSVGALVVLWSAQVTVGKFLECLGALFFR